MPIIIVYKNKKLIFKSLKHLDYETLTQVYSVGIKNIIQNFILCYENIMFVLHNKQDI